jgi:hypothetical protein
MRSINQGDTSVTTYFCDGLQEVSIVNNATGTYTVTADEEIRLIH